MLILIDKSSKKNKLKTWKNKQKKHEKITLILIFILNIQSDYIYLNLYFKESLSHYSQ